MHFFTQTVLFTDSEGRARFREEKIALPESSVGAPLTHLSALRPASAYQLRQSEVGFCSDFHCTSAPQWVFVLSGCMEITLQDGSSKTFCPGEHFYAADTLPSGAAFNPQLHGHRSRQVGPEPLVTLFLRD